MNRPLSTAEFELARWMLRNGTPEAHAYLDQLGRVEVTPWRCPCGCASIQFQIAGHPEAPPGVHVLGDFLAGGPETPFGIFIYESGGLLSGIEVYGLAGDAPTVLPGEDTLRPFGSDASPNGMDRPRRDAWRH